MSYRIDHAAVRRIAAEDYGILGPVRVSRISRRRQKNGHFNIAARDNGQGVTWLREGGADDGAEYIEHHIRLDGNRNPALVALTLGHELQHFAQAERAMRETRSEDLVPPVRKFLLGGGPYETRPSEVEAREVGARMQERILRECFK